MREVGADIQISPNASRIVQHVGLGEKLAKFGVRPLAFHQRRWEDGRTLLRTPLGDAVLEAFGFPYYQVHRGDLLTMLTAALPTERLHLGDKLAAFEERGDRVSMQFDNVVRADADLMSAPTASIRPSEARCSARDQAAIGNAAALNTAVCSAAEQRASDVEWMPSAPIIRSASARAPLSNCMLTRSPALLESGQLVAEMQALRRQCRGQHREQVPTMHLIIRKAEGFEHRIAERRPQQSAAVLPATLMKSQRPHAELGQFLAEAEMLDDARGVGADLDAGADLAHRARLLIDMDVKAGAQQIERSRRPTNAAANRD